MLRASFFMKKFFPQATNVLCRGKASIFWKPVKIGEVRFLDRYNFLIFYQNKLSWNTQRLIPPKHQERWVMVTAGRRGFILLTNLQEERIARWSVSRNE